VDHTASAQYARWPAAGPAVNKILGATAARFGQSSSSSSSSGTPLPPSLGELQSRISRIKGVSRDEIMARRVETREKIQRR